MFSFHRLLNLIKVLWTSSLNSSMGCWDKGWEWPGISSLKLQPLLSYSLCQKTYNEDIFTLSRETVAKSK
jgi:hypothetical protein